MVAVGYDPLFHESTDTDPPPRIGDDPTADGLFPIEFVREDPTDDDSDWELPDGALVQEVELERANVARAPTKVMQKALMAAIEKIEGAIDAYQADPGTDLADYLKADPAGRLQYRTVAEEGVAYGAIDAPLENLALYQALMTAGGMTSEGAYAWPDVIDAWDTITDADGGTHNLELLAQIIVRPDDSSTPENEAVHWDPAALIGAAWSKRGEITLDALIYENTTLGVNVVSAAGAIDYFDFTEGDPDDGAEAFDYVRSERYDGTMIRWIDDTGDDPAPRIASVYDAVFGGEEWGDEQDVYLDRVLDSGDPDDPADDMWVFKYADASDAGVNDFAQAADDARAVIEFIHANLATEYLV